MAILAECPTCHKKHAVKNRLCSCGADTFVPEQLRNKVASQRITMSHRTIKSLPFYPMPHLTLTSPLLPPQIRLRFLLQSNPFLAIVL